jgi:CubicO group peptidase (beta-lactamase class C family)
MAQLRTASPSSAAVSAERLDQAAQLIRTQVEAGAVGAAAVLVARDGRIVLNKAFGKISAAPDAPPVAPDSVFLVASITKPVTVASLMLLVERGLVSLNDPVNHYLPQFTGGDRDAVRVRDLLSHTSGLPDMLPDNTELRRSHAPISVFIQHIYSTPLLFKPGTSFSYQSMGILLAAAIVEKTTGTALRDFQKKEIFAPLGMKSTSLGPGGRRISDLVQVLAAPGSNAADEASFGPNSPYWRDFGAPWGGMHTTTSDLAILLQTFLDRGAYAGRQIFSPATVRVMTSDQNAAIQAPWGLGWALARSKAWNAFGDLVSPKAFGHAGATGTVAWADPESRLICVILTNRPYGADEGHLLRAVSNVVAASVEAGSRP